MLKYGLARSTAFLVLLILSIQVQSVFLSGYAKSTALPAKSFQSKTFPPNFILLAKGVNVDGWFSTSSYSDEKAMNYLKPKDIKQLKTFGFTHIRLPVEPALLLGPNNSPDIVQQRLSLLAKAVKMITANGLAVVVDMHTYQPSINQKLATDNAFVQDFSRIWTETASQLGAINKQKVFFEVFNEPNFQKYSSNPVERWRTVQDSLIQAIRKGAPKNTLIVNGGDWGSIASLKQMGKVSDPNVVYSMHYYSPLAFTHQGSNWSGKGYSELHDLPYPVNTNCNLFIPSFSISAQALAKSYCASQFNSSSIAHDFDKFSAWSKVTRVPLYLGEFGVLKDKVASNDRANWLRDVRLGSEKNSIGWCMWEYNRSFGLLKNVSGSWDADPQVLQALGLHRK